MSVPEPVAARVRRRAQGRCEYCRMSQSLQGATFHVEHIVPRSRGGTTTDENLALACPGCNLRKADRIATVDPLTNSEVPLFHPRRDRWADHFEWDGIRLVGTSSVGRATLVALELNHARRTRIREAEAQFGLFPPR
jgi:hypothetical protein